ncbi:hypothetical protein NSQ89_01010 [Niallia sp. FSL R7-0648]|uniref:hypothetical protein n=1 Tax=Niallia sp. FSL R7-0648 TaxID=2954521 RepID=UPI0030FC72C0
MKIMKYSKTLLILSMIVPWVTVPLLGKNTLKRYIAASTFIALMVRLTNIGGGGMKKSIQEYLETFRLC